MLWNNAPSDFDAEEGAHDSSRARTSHKRLRARHRRPQWPRRLVRGTAIIGAAALMSTGVLAAQASPGDTSVSSARFLSGTLVTSAGTLDGLAALNGVNAANSGNPTPDTQTSSLDLTALGSLTVSLPSGVNVPLTNFLQLGAVNQYAQASDNGVSRSASGAVSNSGAVSLDGSNGFPADATVDLVDLLGSSATGVLDTGNLHVGAVTGVAALGPNSAGPAQTCSNLSAPVNCRDYNVASAGLNLSSPLVGTMVSSINSTLDMTSTTVNGLSTTLQNSITSTVNTLLSALTGPSSVNVSLNVDLRSALATVLSGTLSQGGVTLDLSNGAITVDLATVIGGLDNRSPNTPLLSATVINAVVTDLDGILQQLQTNINSAVTTALNNAAVGITASFCEPAIAGGCTPGVTGGELDISYTGTLHDLASGSATIDVSGTGAVPALLALLGTPLGSTLATTLGGVASPVLSSAISGVATAASTDVTTLTTALDPVLTDIGTVAGATLNVQEAGGAAGAYREVAVRVSVLGGTATTIDLGRAEVGPNAAAAPAIGSLNPTSGPTTGGTSVTVTGTGFLGATGVTFDGTAGSSFTVVNDTTITVTTPAHAAGTVNVVVQSPKGDSAPGTFSYVAPPAITGLTPTSGPETGGTDVTITGSGFTGSTGVTFGGTAATNVTVVNDTTITATTPVHAAGSVDVIVQNPIGNSAPGQFTFTPVTAVGSLSPTQGPVDGGTVVTITGSGFTGATGVTFDGLPGTAFSVDSATQITVTTPAHAAGAVDVVVQSPNGDATDANAYTYVVPPATLASLSPTQGPETGGTAVTLTGSGFTGATGVTFGGAPGGSFTVVNDTTITVTSPPHAPGAVDVIVDSPFGNSSAGSFTYTPVTTITGVTPGAGPEDGGTQVTIAGHCFAGATGVDFGNVPATSFTVVSDTEITAVSPAGTGIVDVTVHGSQACGVGTAPGAFTYQPPTTPVLNGLTPVRGPQTGGTVVTITGSNFTGATGVTFDGVQGTSFTVNSDTQITVTAPAHAPATVDVIVQGPDGQGGGSAAQSNAGEFTYYAVTQIGGVSPGSGPTNGGTTVTITGQCFTGATNVLFGSKDAAGFTVVNGTTITAVTPAGTGTVDVTVVGAGECGSSTLAGGFSYLTAAQTLAATGGLALLGSGILTAIGLLVAGGILLVIRRRRAA